MTKSKSGRFIMNSISFLACVAVVRRAHSLKISNVYIFQCFDFFPVSIAVQRNLKCMPQIV